MLLTELRCQNSLVRSWITIPVYIFKHIKVKVVPQNSIKFVCLDIIVDK